MPRNNVIPDGNEEIAAEIPPIVGVIARTARWVHPQTFQALPVWCPWTARKRPLYDSKWQQRATNTRRDTGVTSEKFEGNVAAANALMAALSVAPPKPKNWTVCHIWGYDDNRFTSESNIVRNPRYYSCVGNMIWLPSALKAFTDGLPEIKAMLRTCAFHLYGWVCEDPGVKPQADAIRGGAVPEGYPTDWPSPERPGLLPPGTAPYDDAVRSEIRRRKARIAAMLEDDTLNCLDRDELRRVLGDCRVQLQCWEPTAGLSETRPGSLPPRS